ncbi:hypothetical protein PROFUN_13179 [Planoprotostelium fungivorum]|uniref:Beclin-1-like protein n=1 Tax=Planoprotostelium fungivorum TaxID=1890364 RepID=A0A2P6N553_9EUKA|nr:hypothetical protein PROFUN_13179 [Planoprotostelium fungivorum]
MTPLIIIQTHQKQPHNLSHSDNLPSSLQSAALSLFKRPFRQHLQTSQPNMLDHNAISPPVHIQGALYMSSPTSPMKPHDHAKLSRAHALFEFISDETTIEHPLCRECVIKVQRATDRKIDVYTREREIYEEQLQRFQNENVSQLSEEELDAEIKAMEEEEKRLMSQMEDLMRERAVLEEEHKYVTEEEEEIDRLETKYLEHFAEYQGDYQNYLDDNEAVHIRLTNATEDLKSLRETNIYNDTFHISLGRLPSQPVHWDEINAAWGQATLLLYTISRKLAFKFSTYRLLPMGSSSKMERISDNSPYELYGSGDLSLGRLFWYRRFDSGMAAFLSCVSEIGEYAESKDKTFKLPYRIEKEKIGDMSIKLQFNNEETWTKSLKYLLTDLKFLLVYATKQLPIKD